MGSGERQLVDEEGHLTEKGRWSEPLEQVRELCEVWGRAERTAGAEAPRA